MTATALDIVTQALKESGVIGVGQTPLAEDVNDSFTRLNWMLSQWAKKRWLVWQLVTLSKISTGQQFYTVGPGGDFDVVNRPDRIESAFLRQWPGPASAPPGPEVVAVGSSPFVYVADIAGTLTVTGGAGVTTYVSRVDGVSAWTSASSPFTLAVGDAVQIVYTVAPSVSWQPVDTSDPTVPANVPSNSVDTPIDILPSMEDYNRLSLKGLGSFTNRAYYDPAYPLGRLFPYPITPATNFALHISFKRDLPGFTSLQQEVELPPEYMAALHYNLALRLKVAFQVPLSQTDPLPGLAKDALEVLRNANAQVPRLTMPSPLLRPGLYNPISDRSR